MVPAAGIEPAARGFSSQYYPIDINRLSCGKAPNQRGLRVLALLRAPNTREASHPTEIKPENGAGAGAVASAGEIPWRIRRRRLPFKYWLQWLLLRMLA
jgi:hypothetical protein